MVAPSKVDLSIRTRRWLDGLVGVVEGIHGALWLGFLDREELNELTKRFYAASASHSSKAFNLSGFFAWEQAALDEHFSRCRSLLVAAAGGGREMIALLRKGQRTDGFECNRSLFALCEELLGRENGAGRVLWAAPDRVPDELGVYDGCIVGFGAYMHVVGRGARVGFLRGLGAHLRPEGPLLLSFPTRGQARRERYLRALARGVRRLRGADEEVETGDRLVGPFQHLFTEDEIRTELREAGFEPVSFLKQPFGHAVAIWKAVEGAA